MSSASLATCPVCAEEFKVAFGERPTAATNAHLRLNAHMKAEHAERMFFCPRGPGPDSPFAEDFNGRAFWDDESTCSYCGSLHPDQFMIALEAGCEVTPTDKPYKAYIDLPQADPEVTYVGGSRWAAHRPDERWIEATPEVCAAHSWMPWGEGRANEKMWVMLLRRGEWKSAKFYFHHLDEAQKLRFIEMFNERSMRIAYPGTFYVRPFFCRPLNE